MNVWDILIIIVSVLLIFVVLLQQGDDNIQDAFSGEQSELFKDRKTQGFELFMLRATTVLSVLFVVFVVISNIVHTTSL